MSLARRIPLPIWVQDLLLAGFVTVMQVQGTFRASQNAAPEIVFRPLSELGYLGYVLLAVSGLVLAVRRRWPFAVFVATATLSMIYFTADFPNGPAWMGLFVALYTLTAYGDGRQSVRVVTAGIAVLAVVWILSTDFQPATTGWLFFRIGAAVMAAALGESVRTRRVIAAEAEERANWAERTREEEVRRRVDAERLRIAREVHDTVAHAIAIINIQAGVTAHVLEKRPGRAGETLVTIEKTSARALHEMRAILGVLRGGERDDDGTPTPRLAQVDEIVAVAREAGLDARLDAQPPTGRLPSAVETVAYRIVQESITNVIRHAGASRVTVRLRYGRDNLEIRVTDDGQAARGPGDTADTGRGIEGMRERCALLGGELTVGHRPEGGFEVLARLPMTPVRAPA